MEIDENAPLALSLKAFKTNRKPARNKKQSQAQPEDPIPPSHDLEPADEHSAADAPPSVLVSEFDYSVENHFKAVDTIAKLCGYSETLDDSEPEVNRLSDSITFLRHWKDFNYKPRIVRFACQHNSEERDVIGEVTLPQFSSAAVPQKEIQNGSKVGAEHSKDFVMHVGGAVWALDWCPRVDWNPENCIKPEFVAVAAHPPEDSYHKIGAILTGRGVVQIWCFLTIHVKDVPSQGNKKIKPKSKKKETDTSKELTVVRRPLGRPRKKPLSDRPKGRPRGRPRKKPLSDTVEKIDTDNQHVQPLAIEYPMGSPRLNSLEGTSGNASKHEECVRIDKDSDSREHPNVLLLTGPEGSGDKQKAGQENQIHTNSLHFLRQCQHGQSPPLDPLTSASVSLDSMSPDKNIDSISSSANTIPVDVALPRMMLCLAHNGKVVWDVKWRPGSACYPESRNIMGYLAVLLGSGALEVWEVPLPHAVKLVYPSLQEHIDPRFIKLQPVFRCSMLKCGDRRSIPLTLEWSVSSPHDMILAGCHDGVVAIWKFSVNDSLTESRPLIYISADTGPVRTLAWAPIQSNLEGANIIITAGSKGFKFWDIRDPFHPLWVHPFQGITYGLDWLPDPRCIFGSMEDGTMWLLSLERASHDIPVTGKCHNVASKHGFHSFHCSSFAIWSLQASRLTGMVAYCGEEGSTICFKPTTRSLKDPSRNRVPHYLCGSILEEEGAIIIASPLLDSSFQTKSPGMKRSRGKEEERRAKEQSNRQVTAWKEERDEEMEAVPPKIVAMHRVRWNVNRGSEKWLCYGGAAGLLRCQELHSSTFS
ncbi:Transducin/WD40 repeat-like superfamily protein [Perilla frutescens var. frutescens]|nr:Transducin/WD40 repeat-like superfamily protein [Perilla frutescens var. frutescens]